MPRVARVFFGLHHGLRRVSERYGCLEGAFASARYGCLDGGAHRFGTMEAPQRRPLVDDWHGGDSTDVLDAEDEAAYIAGTRTRLEGVPRRPDSPSSLGQRLRKPRTPPPPPRARDDGRTRPSPTDRRRARRGRGRARGRRRPSAFARSRSAARSARGAPPGTGRARPAWRSSTSAAAAPTTARNPTATRDLLPWSCGVQRGAWTQKRATAMRRAPVAA